MKKTIILLFAAGLLILACTTQQKKQEKSGETLQTKQVQSDSNTALKPAMDSSQFTAIQWLDSMYIDIGTVKSGKTVPLNFRFKNTGSKVLHIDSVWAECGCTLIDAPKTGIEPNKTGIIKAQFDTKTQAIATHVKRIFVVTNTAPHTGSVLTFKAKIVE